MDAVSPASGLWRSRVARQLLGLFVACALLPTLALAGVAWVHVRGELESASRRRLHETSKALGMGIHERLLFLETALRPLAERLEGAARDASLPPELVPHLRERFVGMRLAGEGAEDVVLFGDPLGLPLLTPEQTDHLAAGGVVVASTRADRATARVALLTSAGRRGVLVAEAEPAYLLRPALDAIDADGQEFCVLDAERRPVACSSADPLLVDDALGQRMGHHASGHFDWSPGGRPHLAHYWVLFLKGRFASPSWTIVLGESRAQVFASLRRFSTSFALVVLGSLLAVVLLSIGQIRRSLVPLRLLLEGTRRVARRDFSGDVGVRSGDEFEELAEAFNTMTRELDRQFRGLATRNELDRAILSSMNLSTIIDTVLERAPELLPCDAVAVLVLEGASSTVARSHLAEPGAPGRSQRDEVMIDLEAVSALEGGSELQVRIDEEGPGFLKPLAHRGMRSALLLPILAGGHLAGILAVGRRAPDSAAGHEARALARQLADQVALAFANAQMLERVRFLAYHDPLTKLPNRRRFTEDLEQALDRARRRGISVGVIFFDLDDFKRVNDTLGHGLGDALLRSVARRVRERVACGDGRPEFELARLGGDEFTLLATDIESMEQTTAIAEQLLRALAEPFRLGSHEVFVSGSVGIAMYPFDGDEATTLMKNADTAMHAAKELGKNRFQFYTRSMNEAAVERVTLEGQLRRALEQEEFELFYQAIVDLPSGRIAGAEALVRWRHPELGLLLPGSFVRVAEEIGLIVPLGEWILGSACAAARRWQRERRGDVTVSVNLSGRQFREEKLVDTVARALTAAGLHPSHLSLEITESMLMTADPHNLEVLRSLRALGVRIAVDDFGTGYSSLAYLKHFPVDTLKIDQSFVRDVAVERDDAAIARAVIALGRTLQLRVVAEGVESHEQLEFLRRHGCDAVQGFLIGRPLPAEEFARHFLDGTLG